jgi:Domain of unknown function (DUF4399)
MNADRHRRHRSGRWKLASLIGITGVAGCGSDDSPERSVTLTAPEHNAGGTEVAMALGTRSDTATLQAGEHFHLFVDAGCAAEGEPFIPDLDQLEFPGTTGVVHLAPGQHQLCVQLADGSHTATNLTAEATVNVGIESVAEWCAVAEEIDSLFETIDTSDETFTVKQISYHYVGRLFEQLTAALLVFEADDRAAVAADIDLGVQIVTALTAAPDQQHAQAALADIAKNPQVAQGVEARQQLCNT